MSTNKREQIDIAAGVLHGAVLQNVSRYIQGGGSPPGPTNCRVLAFGLVKGAIVATDDLGMHLLAAEFKLAVWHGWELLASWPRQGRQRRGLVREVLLRWRSTATPTWRAARYGALAKVFGRGA